MSHGRTVGPRRPSGGDRSGAVRADRATLGQVLLEPPVGVITEEDLRDRVVVGTTAEVIDRLGELRELLGMDLLIVRPQVPGGPEGAQVDSLERLVADVWPALV